MFTLNITTTTAAAATSPAIQTQDIHVKKAHVCSNVPTASPYAVENASTYKQTTTTVVPAA